MPATSVETAEMQNLDCLDSDDLKAFAIRFRGQPELAATDLFGSQPASQLAYATDSVVSYAVIRHIAMEKRLAREIIVALILERHLERIYERLPAWARW